MNFFIAHYDTEIVKQEFVSKLNNNISIFMDVKPTQEQLNKNPINIIIVNEPNEYFGLHDWVITNQHLFKYILTWNCRILSMCKNAHFIAYGDTWFLPEQYNKEHDKIFKVAHLCGKLLLSYGHGMRHELLARQNEIVIPKQFYHTIGSRHDISNARLGKEQVFGDAAFGICIENFSNRGWFTEKLLDCFLLRTIPVYWGCSDIQNFFNINGIIKIENVDDCIYKLNNLTESYYTDRLNVIEENYEAAKNYINLPKRTYNKLIELNLF